MGPHLLKIFKLNFSQRRITIIILEVIKKWREVERCGWESHKIPYKEQNECS